MARSSNESSPTVARFRVTGEVSPRLTDAVVVGDSFRKGLMSKSDGAPVFSGRSPDGDVMRDHRHVHIIPEALERHGRITHVTLFAPMGFNERAQSAIARLRKVWSNGTVSFDLQTILLGIGHPQDFAGRRPRAGHCLALAEAKRWRSRTPFVPTRHRKTYNDGRPKLDANDLPIGGPEHDLRRLLDEAGLPEPVAINQLSSAKLGGKKTSWLDFRTERPSGAGRKSTYRGFGFQVEFSEPLAGPICMGYGAHYGLGRFEPCPIDE
jgi:CRISPR-associated protein Csb2